MVEKVLRVSILCLRVVSNKHVSLEKTAILVDVEPGLMESILKICFIEITPLT